MIAKVGKRNVIDMTDERSQREDRQINKLHNIVYTLIINEYNIYMQICLSNYNKGRENLYSAGLVGILSTMW